MPRKHVSPDEIQREFEDFVRSHFGGESRLHTRVQDKTHPKDDPLAFKLRPREVKAHLDRFVIGQDAAKCALAIAVCDHYNYVRHARLEGPDETYTKQNILLLGPTGVGKTYLVRQIAKLIGVPFVQADATRFSETGYVGANVEDLVRDLVTEAAGDLALAECGIIYLDEADKLGTPPNLLGRDVSGRGVQTGLLKLMEETEIDLSASNDVRSQLQALLEMQQRSHLERRVVNTRHILFIMSGVFTALEDIIRRRLGTQVIGFSNDAKRGAAWSKQVSTRDLIDFGFELEFIARLPVRIVCHELTAEDLYCVLKRSRGSILRQYERSFAAYGIKLTFTDEALSRIADLAHLEKTGARALVTVCERTLRPYKFELPSSPIRELLVTEAVVDNPEAELKRLLNTTL